MAVFNGKGRKSAYDNLPLDKKVGLNIKYAREQAGMSTEKLAEISNHSFHTVWRAERGEGLKLSKIEAIAKALNCPIGFLIPRDYDSDHTST